MQSLKQTLIATTEDRTLELAKLASKAQEYVAHSKAANTLRAYRSDWAAFTEWCELHGLPSLPATPSAVGLYAADLANGGSKVSTISRRLAAISKAHQTAGFESPCAMKHAPVKEVMDGIRRLNGTAQQGKAALLTTDLKRLISVVPDSLLGRRDTALLLVGFAGGFRRSELVGIEARDIEMVDDGIQVTLRRSKTDQHGAGRVIGIAWGSDPATCPVRAMKRWLKESGITDGPVFRKVDRHGHLATNALTDQVVPDIIKRYATAAGLDPAKFSGHSLRAGLATQAAINGASERSIMKQTGHRSAAMVRRYIRDGELFRENASSKLGL